MKLLGLGDSITWGYPNGPTDSWLTILAEKRGAECINMGVNGETTAQMLRRVPQVLAEQPDIVFFLGGTNDAYQEAPLEEFKRNVTAIAAQITETAAATLFVCLPTPVQETAAEALLLGYREWLRQFAADNHLPLIDFYEPLRNPQTGNLEGEYDTDGCHPSRKGYEKMAEVALANMSS
ncbi:hypothetical protein JQN58_20325 [Aneurinibacillus sp. BA2021]|nr:hypothetical protein [Aneurinibacillus sp. BA2021]